MHLTIPLGNELVTTDLEDEYVNCSADNYEFLFNYHKKPLTKTKYPEDFMLEKCSSTGGYRSETYSVIEVFNMLWLMLLKGEPIKRVSDNENCKVTSQHLR